MEWLLEKNVFFSHPLDLDMMMLAAFDEVYGEIAGVDSAKDAAAYKESVFGEAGDGLAAYASGQAPTALQLARYEALFKKGSKPAAHVEALAKIDDIQVQDRCPEPLQALFDRCQTMLGIDMDDDLADLLG